MCRHSVYFYDGTYPVEAASDFVAAGLRGGDTCVVMLAQPARSAVERRLKTHGIDIGPDSGRAKVYRAIDTHEALSELVVDGRLDRERSAEVLGRLLSEAGESGRMRLVGDPAAVLFAAGNEEDANVLEDLVNELALQHSALVFCAYELRGFFRHADTNALLSMSARHCAVTFPEGLWIRSYLAPATAPR